MFKHLFLLAFGFFSIITPAGAQRECNLDVGEAQTLLSQATDTENTDDALRLISQARSSLELIESRCMNYAPESAGDSRVNPVPFGQRQKATITDDFVGSIQLVDYTDDAESFIMDLNDRNKPAPEGTRYIAFRLKYACEKAPSESCEFSIVHFSVVGDKGVSYRYDSSRDHDISIRGLPDNKEIFGGAEIEEVLAFLVDNDDNHFVLFTEYGKPRVFFAAE